MQTIKFTRSEVQYAIFSLSNLLSVGIVAAEAFREMQKLQPKQVDFWKLATQQASGGQSLAEILKPFLDTASYSAISAAELSGTLAEVFAELEKAMEEKNQIRKTMFTITYPFLMFIAAIGTFTLFLAFVVPAISKSRTSNDSDKSTLNVVADTLHDFLTTYYMHLGIVLLLGISIFILWLKEPKNRNIVIGFIDRIPMLGTALRDLYYGEWAMHMAINTNAGVTILEAIKLTHTMLPEYFHQELLVVVADATRKGLSAAATPIPLKNDPRNKLPFLITNAFRFADRTGVTDIHFKRAGNALIVQGKKRITLFVAVATNIIIPFAAIMIAGSIIPYFMQISDSISKLH